MTNELHADNHPEMVNLIGFIDDPDASEFRDIELHLASCADCRQKLSDLSQLQINLKSNDFVRQHAALTSKETKSVNVTTALNNGDIENYVDQKLSSERLQDIAKLLNDEPHSLKAALHYASHQSAMNREISESNSKVSDSSNKFKFLSIIKKYFTQATPAWVMVPATGFATVLMLMVINLQFQIEQNQDSNKIASYQDNAVIQFSARNTQPGIGFFSNARKNTKPFDNVTVSISGDGTLEIYWPPVENSLSYSILIKKIENEKTTAIAQQLLSVNRVKFKNIQLEKNRRYQWILTGKTVDNNSFYATGGFISH